MDLLIKRSSNRHLLSAVYRIGQPIWIDTSALDQSILQQKQSVVNTLFERTKKLSSTDQDLNKRSMWNGRSPWIFTPNGWFKTKTKNRNNTVGFLGLCLKFVHLGESLKRILEKHRKRTIFKSPLNQAKSYLQEKISYPPANVEV